MLQQTLERLQATFMSLPDYVFELNAETKLVKIHNLPSHLSTFGVLATEGTPLSQLFDKITVEQVEKCIEKVRKSGQSERIEVSARRYGLQCEAEITVTPIQHQHLLCIFRDISEQKKAEFERNKSELRFSRLMENMSIGLLEVDIDEKIVQASPRFVEMSGYTLEELQNKHVWELMISTDKVGANYKYELLNRRKISKGPFEQRIRTKNGEILDLQISGAPLYDIHGNLVGHSGLHIDVTERNKERRLFQQVRELATMGIFIIDLEKNDIFWDDITRSIFEVEEAFEPTIENGIDFYKEGDSRNRISQAVEEAIVDGKGCNGIFEIVTALGNTKWIRVVAYTEKIKTRVVKIVGHTIDITREKLQEIKIQQLNEHYEAISAATSQMLFRWTLDTDIIEFNEVFQTVTGYNNKIPPLNLGHSLLKNIHPDDYQSLKANLHNAIEKKQLLTCRYRFLVSSGQYRHMAANVVALYNERGKVEKLIGTIEDITAHVELQEELNRQKIETQKRLDEAAMVVEQQERHFIGQELHDNACQLLVSASLYLKKAKKQRYQQQETMEEVEDLLQQCLKDIRGLSHRLASENMLEHGLHQALLDLQKRMSGLTNTQLLLEVDLVEESTIHSSLQMLLYRICQEMLSNVIKYSNASKCIVQLHTIGQQEVQLTISDNGKGFNMKTVQKGLGLQHTIKRVAAFGGHYDIQAYEGKGCTITFSVPLQHLIKS